MKAIVIASLMITASASAGVLVEIKNEEVVKLHSSGEAGMREFVMANGFRLRSQPYFPNYYYQQQQQQQQGQQQQYSQQQQQQQPQYQYPSYDEYCGVKQTFAGAWKYSELMDLGSVLSSERIFSARSATEGFSVAPYTPKLNEKQEKGVRDLKVTCKMDLYTQQINHPVPGSLVRVNITDKDCLKSCEDNGAENCKNICTETLIRAAEPCHKPAPEMYKSLVSCSLETL